MWWSVVLEHTVEVTGKEHTVVVTGKEHTVWSVIRNSNPEWVKTLNICWIIIFAHLYVNMCDRMYSSISGACFTFLRKIGKNYKQI